MSKDLTENRQSLGVKTTSPYLLLVGKDETIKNAKAFFDERFKKELYVGKHEASIKVYAQKARVLQEYPFFFYIFDYQKDLLETQKEDFKYGWGITSQPQTIKYVFIKTQTVE